MYNSTRTLHKTACNAHEIINIHYVYRPINRQASQLTLARLSSLISVDDLIQDDMRSNFNGTCTVKSQPQINGNIRARLLNTNK